MIGGVSGSRAAHVALIDWLRGTVRPNVAEMKRGYIEVDSACISGITDGLLVGSALGLRLVREADLGNDEYTYKDPAGSTIYQNWT